MRTRAAGAPNDSTGSTDTPAMGLLALDDTELATPSPVTLRRSMLIVSGSGLVATYPTGSVASIMSDEPLLLTRELMVISRTPAVAAAGAAELEARRSA